MGRWWLFVIATLLSTVAAARDYRVDDLLKSQSFGEAIVAEAAGLVLFERRRPYDQADDYSLHYFVRRRLSNIEIADLRTGKRLEPLFPDASDAGYWLGPLSPSGRRLAVFRLRAGRLSLGVVDLRTRAVRWLPAHPDLPLAAPAPTWMNEDELAFVAMSTDRLPYVLSLGRALQEDLPDLWRRQADGLEPSSDAFSAKGGPEVEASHREFVIADVRSGRTRSLAEGAFVDFSVSPDRDRIALVVAGLPVPPPLGPMDTSFVARRHSVLLMDGRGRRLGGYDGDAMPGTLDWNAAGTRLLIVVGHGRGDWTDARFATMDRSGVLHRVGGVSGPAVVTRGSASSVGRGWLGQHPIGIVTDGQGRERWAALLNGGIRFLDVPIGASLAANDRSTAWFVKGSELLLLSKSRRRTLLGVRQMDLTHLDPFSVGTRPVRRSSPLVALIDGAGGPELRLDVDPTRPHSAVRVLPDDRVLASSASAAVVMREARSGAAALHLLMPRRPEIVLDRINEHYDELDPLRAIRLTSVLPSSTTTSWLYVPQRAGVAQLPLIVIPYPGSTWSALVPSIDAASNASSNDNVRILLAAGYAVLRPGMPGNADAARRPDTIVTQVEAAVDAASAVVSIDARRIAVMGHSFGAYAALTLATRSKRFNAVIAENGIYDMVANHGTIAGGDSIRMETGLPLANTGWTEGGQGGMLKPPSPKSKLYVTASPGRWIAGACAPILLIHGDVDTVSIGGSERLFLDLARQGHDVSMVRYHGEGHILYSPANIRDYYARTLAFLADRMPPPDTGSAAGDGRTTQLHARNQASKLACTTRER